MEKVTLEDIERLSRKENKTEEELERLESLLEDVELDKLYGSDIERIEAGEGKSYILKEGEDIFDLLDKRNKGLI